MMPGAARLAIVLLLTGIRPDASAAPFAENYDSIFYNSTCVNATILFGSTLFDSIPSPSFEQWDFGDPSSGIYDQAQVLAPTHRFAAPGTYTITLKVVNSGSTDTVLVRGSI